MIVPDFKAYVNHGRWIVECPTCNGAELVTPGQTTFRCRDQSDGKTTGVIVWPLNISEIVDILAERPHVENRNWLPWESVNDLIAENIEHGVRRNLIRLPERN